MRAAYAQGEQTMRSSEASDKPDRMGRRGFLQLTVVGGLAVSGASRLAACGQAQQPAPPTTAPAAPAGAATAKPAAANFYKSGLVAKDDFSSSLINTITVDGKTMAVPFDNHGWGLYYNTKLISDAGLDPNALPKNGDEFLKWAFKLTTDESGKHP